MLWGTSWSPENSSNSKYCPIKLVCYCFLCSYLDQSPNPQQDFNRHITKKKRQSNKHIKRCSLSLFFRKPLLKATWVTTTYPLNEKDWHYQVVVKTWCKMIPPLWKTVCQFLMKSNIYHVVCNSTSQYYLLKENKSICPCKVLYVNIHSCFIHIVKNWKLENQCSSAKNGILTNEKG